MKKFIQGLPFIITASAFYASCLMAADLPAQDLGAMRLDSNLCLGQTAEHCINTLCLTSEERDCQEECRKMAADKCQEELDE